MELEKMDPSCQLQGLHRLQESDVVEKGKLRCGRHSERYFRFFEALILTLVMLIITGLCSIPTIYYALGTIEPSIEPSPPKTVSNSSACLQIQTHTGDVCRETLTTLQTCFSGDGSAINIPLQVDQQVEESNAMNFVNGLSLLNPSPQCREAMMPFICLSIFQLCDSSGNLHTILKEDCQELRDNVCAEEWIQIVGFAGPGVLPVCEDLLDDVVECVGNHSSEATINTTRNNDTLSSSGQGPTIQCSEHFFFDENATNICRPICEEFNTITFGLAIIFKISLAMGIIAALVVVTLALTVQRDKLLTPPLVFSVYSSITALILFTVIAVGLITGPSLFCASKDLLMSMSRGTPFCTITGVFTTYTLQQFSLWGVLFSVFLFWGVVYPFSYQHLKSSGRIRYTHVISVILSVVIPLPGALIHLKGGFVAGSSPPISCFGSDEKYTYYMFILPGSVAIIITSFLLAVIFWTILKEFVLKKLLARKKAINVGKGEVKIALMISYFSLLGVMGSVVAIRTNSIFSSTDFQEYLICESSGKAANCTMTASIVGLYITITFIILSFVPVMSLLMIFDPRVFKKSK